MALALAVFFVGILNANLLAKKVLAVHGVDSGITSLERIETDEAIAFGDIVIVANDVGLAKNSTKTAECVVENFFVDKGVEVVDEEFCTDIDRLLLVCARLVDTDWFVEDTSAIENSGCILGRSRGIEFDKAVALMVLGDSILWHMDLTHRTHLRHELGEPLLRETLVYVAYVDGGIFILLPVFAVSSPLFQSHCSDENDVARYCYKTKRPKDMIIGEFAGLELTSVSTFCTCSEPMWGGNES